MKQNSQGIRKRRLEGQDQYLGKNVIKVLARICICVILFIAVKGNCQRTEYIGPLNLSPQIEDVPHIVILDSLTRQGKPVSFIYSQCLAAGRVNNIPDDVISFDVAYMFNRLATEPKGEIFGFAKELLLQCLKMNGIWKDPIKVSQVYGQLAESYFNLDLADSCYYYIEKAMEEAREARNESLAFDYSENEINYLIDDARFVEAYKKCWDLILYVDKLGQEQYGVFAESLLPRILLSLNDTDRAAKSLEIISKKYKDDAVTGNLQYYKAKAEFYNATGNFDSAYTYYSRVINGIKIGDGTVPLVNEYVPIVRSFLETSYKSQGAAATIMLLSDSKENYHNWLTSAGMGRYLNSLFFKLFGITDKSFNIYKEEVDDDVKKQRQGHRYYYSSYYSAYELADEYKDELKTDTIYLKKTCSILEAAKSALFEAKRYTAALHHAQLLDTLYGYFNAEEFLQLKYENLKNMLVIKDSVSAQNRNFRLADIEIARIAGEREFKDFKEKEWNILVAKVIAMSILLFFSLVVSFRRSRLVKRFVHFLIIASVVLVIESLLLISDEPIYQFFNGNMILIWTAKIVIGLSTAFIFEKRFERIFAFLYKVKKVPKPVLLLKEEKANHPVARQSPVSSNKKARITLNKVSPSNVETTKRGNRHKKRKKK